ncbi:DUF881 domain-containing protein [Georgenia sp. Z1344]|uniref:DUF881 domain-containing protein n=1 Tax=Georgenia sp. Z1344 TaxID=3416706 RepID=UPI003CF1EB6D
MAGFRVPPASLRVAAVGVLAGLVIAVNARDAGEDPARAATDLVSLARAQTTRIETLEGENEELREQIEPYLESHDAEVGAPPDEVLVAAGAAPVSGPGVEVALDDAPVPESGMPADRVADDYVVHQQDVEGVINALRAGGAEALTVQGQRLLPTTTVRCVGNVLYVGTRVYSPPFVVGAVGDPDELTDALEESEAVDVYRQWVELIGLGYTVTVHDQLDVPPSTSVSTRYAEPLETGDPGASTDPGADDARGAGSDDAESGS